MYQRGHSQVKPETTEIPVIISEHTLPDLTSNQSDISNGADRNKERTYWDQVLLHKWCEHMVPDGRHDVTEVHGGNDAILLFVLLSKSLACMFQLQLLSNKTWHRKAERKHRPIKGNAWNSTPAEGAARGKGSVPARTGWTRGSWGVSYSLAQSANGWTRSPIWRGCGDAPWSGWRCHAHFLQHKWK